jgi:hypothetical protein
METADRGLGRPDASVGESGRGEIVGEGREPLLCGCILLTRSGVYHSVCT